MSLVWFLNWIRRSGCMELLQSVPIDRDDWDSIKRNSKRRWQIMRWRIYTYLTCIRLSQWLSFRSLFSSRVNAAKCRVQVIWQPVIDLIILNSRMYSKRLEVCPICVSIKGCFHSCSSSNKRLIIDENKLSLLIQAWHSLLCRYVCNLFCDDLICLRFVWGKHQCFGAK